MISLSRTHACVPFSYRYGHFWLAGGILSVLGVFVFSGNRLWKLVAGILSIIAEIVILIYLIYSPFRIGALLDIMRVPPGKKINLKKDYDPGFTGKWVKA